MKESRTCKWENFSCNGKWKKFQLGKPQEYELFLGKPQEYELFLGEPQEYELFLGKPQKYELFLGKPQEYELFFFVHSKQSCQASAFPLWTKM